MIKVDTPVHWTTVSKGKGSFSLARKDGTVTAIEGETAKVKTRGGRTMRVAIARLRLAGQPSQITEFVEAVCGRERVGQ